jgi:hypothetical protein
MLYWTIQVIFFSILFILLIHHILDFLKSTLTVPKVKDLVNTRNQKYENIYETITNSNSNNHKETTSENSISYTMEDLLPKTDISMKDELKNFLKSQLNTNINTNTDNFANTNINSDSTEISTLETVTEIDSYTPLL